MLMEHPAIELDPTQSPLPVTQSDGTVLRQIQLMRLKPDVDPEEVSFDTGYDRAAVPPGVGCVSSTLRTARPTRS